MFINCWRALKSPARPDIPYLITLNSAWNELYILIRFDPQQRVPMLSRCLTSNSMQPIPIIISVRISSTKLFTELPGLLLVVKHVLQHASAISCSAVADGGTAGLD